MNRDQYRIKMATSLLLASGATLIDADCLADQKTVKPEPTRVIIENSALPAPEQTDNLKTSDLNKLAAH